jgi:hypothetical protein
LLGRHECERRKDRLSFLEAHVDLAANRRVPAKRGPRKPLGVLVSQEEAELKRFG